MGKIKRIRTLSQTASLIIINLGFLGIFFKHITGPVFNCYACPWASISCPIGLLQNFVMTGQVPTYVLGTMGAVFVFVGSAFCGWVCPFGFFQDAIDFVKSIFKKKNKKLKRKITRTKSKDLSLVTRLIVLVATLVLAIRYVDTIFCKLCPIGTIEATFPYQITNGFSYNIWLGARIGIFVFLVIMFFLISRFWCRYLCPIGALSGPSNKISILKLFHNGENCGNCNICKDVCPLDIDVTNDTNSTRCTRCADCVDKCPKGHLAFGLDIFGLVTVSPFAKKKSKKTEKKLVTPLSEGIPGTEIPKEGEEKIPDEETDVLDEFKFREKGTLVERPAYMGFKKGERIYLPYEEIKKLGVRPPKTSLSNLLKQEQEGRLIEDFSEQEVIEEEKIIEKLKETPKSIPKEEVDRKHFEKFRVPKRTELHLEHLKYLSGLDVPIDVKTIANNSSEVPAVLLAIIDASSKISFEYINAMDKRAEWYYQDELPSTYINGKYYNGSISEDEIIYRIKTERYIMENVSLIIDYRKCIGCNSQSCKKACDIFKKIPILDEGYGIYPLKNIGCTLCGKCIIECDRGGVSFIFGDKLVTDTNFSIETLKKNHEIISSIYPETVMVFLEKDKKHSNRALNYTIALSYLSHGKLSYQLIDVAQNKEAVSKRNISAIPCFWVSSNNQIAGMVSEASVLAFIRKISKWKG